MRLPKIDRLDLRGHDFLSLRARNEWEKAEWMAGRRDKHPHGPSGCYDEIDDPGYFLPLAPWMLDEDAYRTSNW